MNTPFKHIGAIAAQLFWSGYQDVYRICWFVLGDCEIMNVVPECPVQVGAGLWQPLPPPRTYPFLARWLLTASTPHDSSRSVAAIESCAEGARQRSSALSNQGCASVCHALLVCDAAASSVSAGTNVSSSLRKHGQCGRCAQDETAAALAAAAGAATAGGKGAATAGEVAAAIGGAERQGGT